MKQEEESKKDDLSKVKEEEQKIFDSMKSMVDYTELASDCYTEMDSYVSMVANKISFGALIEGMGGTGKTYRTIKQCRSLDMAYTDSYTTPASFYIWLYKNRDKDVLIIDDCAGLFSNDKILAFLKGALWEVSGKRIVNYMTTKHLEDEEGRTIPSTCEINARIIIITNALNKKNPHVNAVLSRINYCYVDIPRDELLSILSKIAEIPYDNLSEKERMECLQYLIENTSESNTDLNIRTLFKLFQFKIHAKQIKNAEFWKVLANKILKKDDFLVLVESLEKNKQLTVQEKVSKFQEITKKSRATYFRLKERISQNIKNGGIETATT